MINRIFQKKESLFSDEKIIQNLAQRKDLDKCIEVLYTNNFKQIAAMIYQMGGNESDAEDIFQDAISKVILSIRKGQFENRATLSTYLYTIARNMWLKTIKKNNNYYWVAPQEQVFIFDQAVLEDIRFQDDTLITKRKFSTLLDGLGDNCMNIIRLFYFEEKTYTEIHNLLKEHFSSEQAIRNRKSKCIKGLKDIIEASKLGRSDLEPVLDCDLFCRS